MTGRSTLPSALRNPMPGDVIAQKYRLERCLGEGGQGCVWRAQNLVLELPVAIKIVHAEAIHGLVPDRLFREARAAATLGHPSIVRVFDIGRTSEGLPYLVMELLRGESLADGLVRAGRLTPTDALRLLLPIADGLVAAHAEGIVHRDVKPDNIFVAQHGDLIQPKLLDFGLARRNKSSDKLGRITDAGAVLGTPAYLSPEQASGKDLVDERADVWSFCTTLYECLAGSVPFQGTSWHELRRQILQEDPSTLLEFGVDDASLWQMLQRGLAKSPVERWPTMQALGRELACWLLERGVTADICGVSLEARWLGPARAERSLSISEPAEVVLSGAPSPRREPTRRIDRSTARRRAETRRLRKATEAPVAKATLPPTLRERATGGRVLSGAAVVLACISMTVLITATQSGGGGEGGIIASSRAASVATPDPLPKVPAKPKPRDATTPVVTPAALPSPPGPPPFSPPAAVSDAHEPPIAHPSTPPRPPNVVAGPKAPRTPAIPASKSTLPQQLQRPRVEPLDLMEPY